MIPVVYEFLLSSRQPNLRGEQIGLHYQAAVEPGFAALGNRLRRFHRLPGDFELFTREQNLVITAHNPEDNLLIRAVQLMGRSLVHLFCPVNCAPTVKRIKQVPASSESCGKGAKWSRRI